MRWWHRILGHRQRVTESKLWDRRDYLFCSCGKVWNP